MSSKTYNVTEEVLKARRKMTNFKQRKEVYKYRIENGWPFSRIAKKFGLSRQRVQQIYQKAVSDLKPYAK